MLGCTHLVLYVKNLGATHTFYVRTLGCAERRCAPEEDFLSVAASGFILNFYGPALQPPLPDGYNQGVAHLGLELPARRDVEAYFESLDNLPRFGSGRQPLRSVGELEASQTPGPYRFYVRDPDEYTVELHSWEGAEG